MDEANSQYGGQRDSRQSGTMSLDQLPFTDLYIRLDDDSVPARFRADPTRMNVTGNLAVPEQFDADVAEVRDMIIARSPDENGTLTFKGYRLRYVKFVAAEDEVWAALRAVSLDLPSLEDLRMAPAFIRTLRGWGNKRGLVIVGGKTGDGKTTTCVAAVKDYLERLGGFAYTVEDPPEYQMQGAISEKGFCLQVEIRDDSKWGDAVKSAMRCRPDIILLGEIRTSEAAEHLLKAVTSGHLVITTVHAGSVPDTISALLQLAESRMGSATARAILADRLVAAVHQTLTRNGPRISVLEPKRESNNDQVSSILMNGDLSSLASHCFHHEPTRRD